MAKGVRFPKAEREVIRWGLKLVEEQTNATKGQLKAASAAVDRMDAAELLTSKRSGGAALSAGKAIDAFREVLGNRLIVPPTPGKLFWITMSRGLGTLGADEDACRKIATIAGERWTGRIKAESLVRQGAALLTEAPGSTPRASTAEIPFDDLDEL